jgi:hypothetical protein
MFDAIQNELQYRFGTQGALKGNIQKDETGTYSPNLLQSALGVSSEQLTNAANQGQRNRFNDTEMGREAASYGVELGNGAPNLTSIRKSINKAKGLESATSLAKATGVDVSKLEGVDEAGIHSLIRTQKELNANEAYENNPRTKKEQDRYYDLQQEKLADRKDARDALTFSREDAQNQRMFARRESSLDRAQTQDLAILSQGHQMKIAQMNQDLAEKRMDYDRETKRMDKRDRMIAQLMSGLGSLGSAF